MTKKENKIYFIGDIHGCINTLKKLIEEKIKPSINDKLIFMGDYIDRGPNTKAVIDELINYRDTKQFKTVFLRGNHEDMLLKSINQSNLISDWKKNGGDTTLESFNAASPNQINNKYIDFLKNTEFYYSNKRFVAVHAGMNFDIDNPFDDGNAMLWRRNKIIEKDKIDNKRLIVAHTPVTLNEAENSLRTDKIMIDGGCVYYDKLPFLGYLIAFEANTNSIISVRNADEQT